MALNRRQVRATVPDEAVRGVAADGRILVLAASTRALCESARRRHDLWPTAAAAVGRTLTAAALLALPLDPGGSITISIRGDGPLGGVVATADPRGHVRGYAHHPHTDLPPRPDGKLDVGGAVGRRGLVRVARDLGRGQAYTGSAPLVSGEIAEDVTSYLWRSEQVPSLVALGVLVGSGGRVRAAGGLLLQLLPDAPPEAAERLEANVARMAALTSALDQERTPEEIASVVVGDYGLRLTSRQALSFHCGCSRVRLLRALRGLPASERAELRAQPDGVEVTCRFCARRYRFPGEDLPPP